MLSVVIIIIPFIFVVFVDHSDSSVETIYEGKTYIKTARKMSRKYNQDTEKWVGSKKQEYGGK